MTLFEELKEKIHSKTDSNFHLKCLDLTAQVWIQELCELIDEKMVVEVVKDDKAKCILDGNCSIQIEGSGCESCIANDHNRT